MSLKASELCVADDRRVHTVNYLREKNVDSMQVGDRWREGTVQG